MAEWPSTDFSARHFEHRSKSELGIGEWRWDLYTYINTYARTFESMLLIVFSRPHGSAKNIMWWWVVALIVYNSQYHLLKHIYRDT